MKMSVLANVENLKLIVKIELFQLLLNLNVIVNVNLMHFHALSLLYLDSMKKFAHVNVEKPKMIAPIQHIQISIKTLVYASAIKKTVMIQLSQPSVLKIVRAYVI